MTVVNVSLKPDTSEAQFKSPKSTSCRERKQVSIVVPVDFISSLLSHCELHISYQCFSLLLEE